MLNDATSMTLQGEPTFQDVELEAGLEEHPFLPEVIQTKARREPQREAVGKYGEVVGRVGGGVERLENKESSKSFHQLNQGKKFDMEKYQSSNNQWGLQEFLP